MFELKKILLISNFAFVGYWGSMCYSRLESCSKCYISCKMSGDFSLCKCDRPKKNVKKFLYSHPLFFHVFLLYLPSHPDEFCPWVIKTCNAEWRPKSAHTVHSHGCWVYRCWCDWEAWFEIRQHLDLCKKAEHISDTVASIITEQSDTIWLTSQSVFKGSYWRLK